MRPNKTNINQTDPPPSVLANPNRASGFLNKYVDQKMYRKRFGKETMFTKETLYTEVYYLQNAGTFNN